MKRSRAVVAGVWAAVAGATLFLGCEEWRTRNVPMEPKPAPYSELEMRASKDESVKTPLPQAATSPRKAYELYSKAIKDKDFETCWRLFSRGTQKMFDGEALALRDRIRTAPAPVPDDLDLLRVLGLTPQEVDKVDGKQLLVATFRRAQGRDPQGFEFITRTEFDHEDVWGDEATVYVRADGKLQPKPMRLVREGGVWHFDLAKPAAPTP